MIQCAETILLTVYFISVNMKNEIKLACVVVCQMYRKIQQQAGFIEFAQQHFEEAADLFREGQVDVREVGCVSSHGSPIITARLLMFVIPWFYLK